MDPKKSVDYESDDSSDWSSAQEMDNSDTEYNPIYCLFCCETFETIETTFAHLITSHNLDLIQICNKNKFNVFQYIKLLNYIRLEKPNCNQINEIIESKVWDKDQYMKPIISDDPLLMFGIIPINLLIFL
jgi:protein arginine N-methyltransferase 3